MSLAPRAAALARATDDALIATPTPMCSCECPLSRTCVTLNLLRHREALATKHCARSRAFKRYLRRSRGLDHVTPQYRKFQLHSTVMR